MVGGFSKYQLDLTKGGFANVRPDAPVFFKAKWSACNSRRSCSFHSYMHSWCTHFTMPWRRLEHLVEPLPKPLLSSSYFKKLPVINWPTEKTPSWGAMHMSWSQPGNLCKNESDNLSPEGVIPVISYCELHTNTLMFMITSPTIVYWLHKAGH